MKKRGLTVVYEGREMRLAEAMRASGCSLPFATVSSRIRDGWAVQRALTQPAENRAFRFALRPFAAENEKP